MTRLAITLCLGVAVLLALKLGGTLGTGVVAGAGLGVFVAGLGVLYQRHLLRVQPQRAFAGFVLVFAFKLGLLIAAWSALRFVPGVAERVDVRGFLLAYASVLLVVGFAGLFAIAKLTQTQKPAPLKAELEPSKVPGR